MQFPCIMFKSSTNLCSHLVAVAEKEIVLSIYLDWVRTSKSDCNLYHLATKNVNARASGQKGGKEKRNRKTQKNPQPLFTITNQEQLLLAAMGTHQSAPNVSVSRTLEATNWQPTVGGHSPVLSAPLASPFHGSPSSFTPESYNVKATSPFTSQPAMPSPGVFVGPYLPWLNNKPVVIMLINGRIKKCAGCRRDFSDPLRLIFVGLVVEHVERDYFNDKNGFRRIENEQARYYHPLRACLMARHQHFNSAMIQLHPEVLINDLQRSQLHQDLGIDVGFAF